MNAPWTRRKGFCFLATRFDDCCMWAGAGGGQRVPKAGEDGAVGRTWQGVATAAAMMSDCKGYLLVCPNKAVRTRRGWWLLLRSVRESVKERETMGFRERRCKPFSCSHDEGVVSRHFRSWVLILVCFDFRRTCRVGSRRLIMMPSISRVSRAAASACMRAMFRLPLVLPFNRQCITLSALCASSKCTQNRQG